MMMQKETHEESCTYWENQALCTAHFPDKAVMYELAASHADAFDPHHANVLRELANYYREGSK